MTSHLFSEVTLLITHYNRSRSLERLLKTFEDQHVAFEEIVVSDDSSKPKHLEYLKSLKEQFNFTLVASSQNKGLANNLNKGQQAVKTPFTLYVQEDFIPMDSFVKHFENALTIMKEEQELDIIRFYAYKPYPYLVPYKLGFSRIIYKPWFLDTDKIYAYTDHPHLRRSTFFERFGKYTEGIKSDKTEYEMCLSFIQNGGQGLFFTEYKSLFSQENSSEEPSTINRTSWRQSDNIFVALARRIYRQVKYNYDLHINKKFKR